MSSALASLDNAGLSNALPHKRAASTPRLRQAYTPSPSALTGTRHRADYSRPPPSGLRTAYVLWLTELVEHFGPGEVSRWDRPLLVHLGARMWQMVVNGRRYYAWAARPGETEWVLYTGARLKRSRGTENHRRATTAPKCSCTPSASNRSSYRIVGGRILGRSMDIKVLCAIAVEHAPARPSRGWTLDDWRMRGFVPVIVGAQTCARDRSR